jgi:hypothetical protein
MVAADPDPIRHTPGGLAGPDVSSVAYPYFRWPDRGEGEDIDFCRRVKALGMRIVVDTRVSIGHVAAISIGGRQGIIPNRYGGLSTPMDQFRDQLAETDRQLLAAGAP